MRLGLLVVGVLIIFCLLSTILFFVFHLPIWLTVMLDGLLSAVAFLLTGV